MKEKRSNGGTSTWVKDIHASADSQRRATASLSMLGVACPLVWLDVANLQLFAEVSSILSCSAPNIPPDSPGCLNALIAKQEWCFHLRLSKEVASELSSQPKDANLFLHVL